MRTVASKIDNDLHEKLIQRCNAQGCSTSEFVRGLIEGELSSSKRGLPGFESKDGDVPGEKRITKVKLYLDSYGNVERQETITPEKQSFIAHAKRVWLVDADGNRREITQS